MMRRVAVIKGKRLFTIDVPLLSTGLSAHWLAFVTDVDHKTATNLVDSMSNEVVVHDTSIHDVVPGEDMGYDESVRRALADRARST
jgi:hypothetical protein